MSFRRKASAAEAVREARRLLMQGATDEYLAYTARAAQRFPENGDIRLEYAGALAASSPDRARAEALKAFELGCSDAVALAQLAGLLLTLGARDAARLCLERAEQAPAPSESVGKVVANELRGIRGALAALEGDNEVAEEALRAAHESDPRHDIVARDLAAFLGSRGRFAEALEVIDQTLATPSREGELAAQRRATLAKLRETLEKGEKAEEAAKAARSQAPTRWPRSSTSTSTSTSRPRADGPKEPGA